MNGTEISTELKKLTYLGYEKTQIAKMSADELQVIVGRWVGKRLAHIEDKDDNGNLTQYAVKCILELDEYVEDQMGAFASRGLPKERAYTDAIVPTGEYFNNNRGESVEKFRIVKRGESLEPVFEDKDGEHGASVRASMKLPSEIFGLRDTERGKFNDAGYLIDQSACSVDRSEALGFS